MRARLDDMSKFLVVRLKDPGQNYRLSDKFRILVGVKQVDHDLDSFDGSTVLKVVLTPEANVEKVAAIAKFLAGVDTVEISGTEDPVPFRPEATKEQVF